MSATLLHLDPGLPPRVPPHNDLVWGFSGWACRPGVRLSAATMVVGAARFPAAGLNTLRLDAEAAQRRHGVEPDLACGFWGLATLPASAEGGTQSAVLALEWTDGTREEWPAGTVAVTDTALPPPAEPPLAEPPLAEPPENAPAAGGPLVAIAMATYNPDRALFRAQIESIRSQTHERWVCLIEDDGSDDAHWQDIIEATSGDGRFRPLRNGVNLGFYRNFERALGRVPAEAEFVALADQDDRWAPGRLAALVAALESGPAGGPILAFGNMRVVDGAGRVVSETFWPGLDSRHDSLDALLMANAVTGCACLFRASLLRQALPFPALGRLAYHDHWIACCAAAEGTIAYLPQSLGDYVQHGANSLGYRRRPGLRLAAKLSAALALAPALALAAQSAAGRRRLAGSLKLLVSVPDAELVCRAAFAETLRRRTAWGGGSEGDAQRTATDTFLPGPRPGRRLLAALLRRGPRGRAFRGVAARLLTGLVIGRLTGLLARLRPPSAAER
ncbi:glycosyl transferase family 2 [Azospirillum brasilense]|uniref:Glycosyl transferase family 2 n=1 Tax=Azospirillum brasilense TaxID=192 RepID=A0A560BWY9_AZOBR|nr:glycosyltransferase [Azospirillum brasilense]TWA77123.1 glycosyl transferase family 2 [Azospirillum brasilense]